MPKYLIPALMMFLLLARPVFAQQSYPATITVAQDGSGNYKTI